jgi:hypothetical protein
MPQVSANLPPEPRDPTVFDPSDPGDPGTSALVPDDEPSHLPGGNGLAADDGEGPSQQTLDAAKEMGWAPRDKWRGPPEQWVDADTFVQRGNIVLPIVKKERDELRTKLADAERKITELQGSSREVAQWFAEQGKARLLRERGGLIAERKEALEAQDMDRVNEIDIALQENRAKSEKAAAQPKPPSVDATANARIFGEFANDNPWLKDSEELQLAMSAEARVLREAGSTRSGREFLEQVADRVKRLYPDKFKSTRRPQLTETDSAHSDSMPTGVRSFANLKPDRQAIAIKWEKQGILTRKEYLANCEPEDFRS